MKVLILFKSIPDDTSDRIAAWVERELGGETVAIDVGQISDSAALTHYVERCDKAIVVGPVKFEDTVLADKPVLRLFPDGAPSGTTLFFDKPETPTDQQMKAEVIRRLQLFKYRG